MANPLIISNFDDYSTNIKVMMIFELISQFESICRMAMSGCAAKLNKSIQTNIIEILILIMSIPRKINFLQLGRHGRRGEQCYRQTFGRGFDWLQFNMDLAANRFQHGCRRLAIAIDPSYLPKAGKKTPHVGRFWSGCDSASKHGLEILGIGLIDADIRDCMMLRAVQTLNSHELGAREMTLNQWYIAVLRRHRWQLLKTTDTLVADAAFSVKTFVDELLPIGFHLVSRLRNDAALCYIHNGKPTGKRGRPRLYDGKIDFSNLDLTKMTEIGIATKGEKAYELVARSKALERNIKLVIHILKDGTHRLYFSTDTTMSGIDVFDIYRTRFQIEFCYRDGHQFTGLRDCQARDDNRLDFAFNASFAAVNVIKVMRKEFNLDISIGQIKSLMVSAHLLHRFFSVSGIDPNTVLNAKLVKELFGIAARAA